MLKVFYKVDIDIPTILTTLDGKQLSHLILDLNISEAA